MTRVTAGQLRVAVDSEYSATLADLISVRKDIGEARTFVVLLVAMPASTHPSPQDQDTRAALWKAVVISYRRAFTSGKSFAKGRARSRYPADIVVSLSEPDRATHEAILFEADKHVAHRVDDDRKAADVRVVLRPPHDPQVAGVSWSVFATAEPVMTSSWRSSRFATFYLRGATSRPADFATPFTGKLRTTSMRSTRVLA